MKTIIDFEFEKNYNLNFRLKKKIEKKVYLGIFSSSFISYREHFGFSLLTVKKH